MPVNNKSRPSSYRKRLSHIRCISGYISSVALQGERVVNNILCSLIELIQELLRWNPDNDYNLQNRADKCHCYLYVLDLYWIHTLNSVCHCKITKMGCCFSNPGEERRRSQRKSIGDDGDYEGGYSGEGGGDSGGGGDSVSVDSNSGDSGGGDGGGSDWGLML